MFRSYNPLGGNTWAVSLLAPLSEKFSAITDI